MQLPLIEGLNTYMHTYTHTYIHIYVIYWHIIKKKIFSFSCIRKSNIFCVLIKITHT